MEFAGSVPAGTPTQQVTALCERISDITDEVKIKQLQEKKVKRSQIKVMLKEKYEQLDRLWQQHFCVGSKVLVRYTGEKRVSWPARVTNMTIDGFQVAFTDSSKLSTGRKVGGSYFVSNHRAPSNLFRQE